MSMKAMLASLGVALALTPAAHGQLYIAFTVTDSVEIGARATGYWDVTCPGGTHAVSGGASSSSTAMAILAHGPMLDGTPLWSVPDGTYLIGPSGWSAAAANSSGSPQKLTIVALCAPVQGMATVIGSRQIADGVWGGLYVSGCPSGTVTVSGGAATIHPLAVLDTSSPAIDGQFINVYSDGAYGVPSGWHGGAFNDSGAPATLFAAAICMPLSEIRDAGTLIGTAVQGPGARVGTNSCGIGTLALGAGISEDGPLVGQIESFAPVFPSLPRFANARPSGMYEAYDSFLYAWYSPETAPVPGRIATVCVEPAGRTLRSFTAVEYFNRNFGHYFVTPLVGEIADLDSGRYPGWARTGQTFRVLEAGTLSTAPVCRYFREDVTSHFYSASVAECASVRGFRGWIFETGWLFSGVLPSNLDTAACPTGMVPLYRLWNGVVNHRYTTSEDIRTQMIAQGYVPEGYGPNGVAMCVPAGN